MSDDSKPAEDGFELDGTFYRWTVSDQGKDLMLIDKFTAMPIQEFFSNVDDNFDRGRAPILLAMIATSIRAEHPDWTVERIVRKVMDLNLSEVVFIEAEVEEAVLPPASAAQEAANDSSRSPSDGSSPSSTQQESSTSAKLSVARS